MLGGQRSSSLGLALPQLDTQRDMVRELQVRQARPLGNSDLHEYLKRAAGPERVDRTAGIAQLAPHTQGGHHQAHTQSKQQPFAEEPQQQGQRHQDQGPVRAASDPHRRVGKHADRQHREVNEQKPPSTGGKHSISP